MDAVCDRIVETECAFTINGVTAVVQLEADGYHVKFLGHTYEFGGTSYQTTVLNIVEYLYIYQLGFHSPNLDTVVIYQDGCVGIVIFNPDNEFGYYEEKWLCNY